MKKRPTSGCLSRRRTSIFFVLMLLLLSFRQETNLYAQFPATSYTFTALSGTYTAITGGTSVSAIEVDQALSIVPIGFTFNYCGLPYTQVNVSSNGWLSFGLTSTNSCSGNDLNYMNSDVKPGLMPLWDDHSGAGGAATYIVEGTAPNRVFTMEWKNWKWLYSASNPVISFQVKLYESTNVVEFQYRQEAAAINGSAGASIGICDGQSTPAYLSLDSVATPTTVSSTNFNIDIATKPATGQIYRFTPPAPCTGTPVAGTAAAASPSICSGSDTLNLTGYTAASGISIQWESSPNGTTWTPITGATNATYITPNLSTTTSYRAKVTCAASSQTATSNTVTVTVTGPAPTVATLPYAESFESWINGCSTTDRPGVSWLAFPANGNNSWRRDDQGASANWGNATNYIYSPVFTAGSHSARFHSGYSAAGTIGIMDLYINLSPAGAKQISFDYINTDGSDSLYVELSSDGGTTWSQLGSKAQAGAWTQAAFSTTATAANAIIRFRARADYGSTDIGIDNLNITGPCTGTPVAGTAAATSPSICSGSDTLNLTGYTVAGGISIQWESSPNGTTWTPITGATNATYITPNLNATTSYRAKVTCAASAQTATSNTVTVTVTAPTPTVATLPYAESFESWINGCSTTDRPGVSWLTFPANGNNSWRRDDQGASANWGNVTNYIYSPVFTQGSHSARFHSGYSAADALGTMDLYINLSPAGAKQISFDYINTDGSDSLYVELSSDGGTTWSLLGSKAQAGAWTPVAFSTTSTAANAIIRFRARADYGSTDIGIDNLNVTGPCTGTPVAGTAAATSPSICSGSDTLNLTGYTVASGISIQWESSPNGTTWTPITGATSATYVTPNLSATTSYRAKVTCAASAQTATSNTVTVTLTGPVATVATLPYTESFESWINGCSTTDRPGVSWLTFPANGNNSWRRDDQGASANWGNVTNYIYSPVFSVGSHSARFHSGYSAAGTIGTMDLYINLSPAGAKQISFDYINTDGSDSLYVELSSDGGTTWSLLGSQAQAGAWTPVAFSTTATAASAIIRFRARADYGSTDIGIDNLNITGPCTGTPVAGTAAATSPSICSGSDTLNLTGYTVAGGISIQWESSPNGTTWAPITGATSATYVTPNLNTTTSYRAKVTCAASAQTATSNTVTVTVTGPTPTPATMPYTESFESWINGCSTTDRPGVSWLTSPANGNNSWRRDDQGASANWGNVTNYIYSPVFSAGSHSARFHSGYSAAGTMGIMDLYINLGSNGTKNITFDYINTDGSDSLFVELSTNGGTSWSLLGSKGTGASWSSVALTTTAFTANAIIRFRAKADYGSTDIGIDNLSITGPPPCPVPTALTATAITATSATLNWTQSGTASQWQIKYGLMGFDVNNAGTSIYTNTKPYALNPPLTPATTYQYYVRTICSPGDTSLWSAVTTFSTACLAAPSITSQTDSFHCGNGPVVLKATASSGSINWYTDPTGGTPLFTGNVYTTASLTATKTYYISAVAGSCESARQPITATIAAIPVVNLGNDTTLCPGINLVLDAGNSGATYTWNTGAATRTLTVNTPGTYSVSVTNAAGCSGSDAITITPGIAPVNVLPATTNLCAGATATLNAGNAGSTYSWTPGAATTQTLNVTTGGTYTVTIKSVNGCAINSSTDVIIRPLPVASLGNDTSICQGATIVLDAGNAGDTYLWNTGATGQTIPVSDSGTYTVMITTPYGCKLTDDKHVAYLPQPRVEGFNFVPLFYENLGKVRFAALNPRDVQRYEWDFGDGSAKSTDVNPTHIYTAAGFYTVTLKVFNGCGDFSISQTINVDLVTGIVTPGKDAAEVSLYPNPSRNYIMIENKSDKIRMEQVTVFSTLGAVVYSQKTSDAHKHQVSVSQLAAGTYTVRIQTDKGYVVRKFEVLH